MIEIIQLNGTEKRLYQLVAPLVMDPEVLRMNNNYPFKTTDQYIWFIAVEGRKVTGFIPVEQRSNNLIINNYYVPAKRNDILDRLLENVIKAFKEDVVIFSVTLTEHRKGFEQYGFSVEKEWKRYVKMRRN